MGPVRAPRQATAVLIAAVLFISVALAAASPQARDAERACFVCHGDRDLVSPAGVPIHVSDEAFSGSVHGRAGVGCLGCHADLAGVEDFPHAPDLEDVTCGRCHDAYTRSTLGGVHAVPAPGLIAKPVLCKDCHGYHGVLRSSDPRSTVHVSNLPATCGRCHPGAGGNYARGRAHEFSSSAASSPAGVARVLYKVLIVAVTAFFLAYAGIDIVRWRRER